MPERIRVLIMGAGGRDFHVFNTCYRDDPAHEVVAFTATQIPGIEHRVYPPELAGPLYPQGVPVFPEPELERLVRELRVKEVVFAYSDVHEDHLERLGRRVRTLGASFSPFDPDRTMLVSRHPCVAVCAVRTGCGKSAVSRHVVAALKAIGRRPVVLRHPMPYGDLRRQGVQRFARLEDLATHRCTIEEMEEYEPHILAGNVVYAGADYARILEAAEQEGDLVVWDGGNNDTPFVKPDLHITLVDPLRPGHELSYFPGRWNVERADVVVVGKTDEARPGDVDTVLGNVARVNPRAAVCRGRSPVVLDDEGGVRGRRALVIEDGPTATHGGMGYGAGLVAARRAGAAEIVDPRPYAKGLIAEAFKDYPHLRDVLPALGYGDAELKDLEATIDAADCDVVVVGTPIDLSRVIRIRKPVVRATYRFEAASQPALADILRDHFAVG
ncbi:MAG: cyclic 2,3-diphosphoglycerate synthase [Planctomycetes bacterium]|nr:cyclic 2,3-diphosphoglycerate synthase [Planctomycetota bacterium]